MESDVEDDDGGDAEGEDLQEHNAIYRNANASNETNILESSGGAFLPEG